MTLNMIKLCVGTESIDDLAAWQKMQRTHTSAGGKACVYHTTFQFPKRQDDLLDGGSLYWVIKGIIQVRQRLVGFEQGTKEDGTPCCLILLDRALVPVRPAPRRAFQGWRYLEAGDAPPDMSRNKGDQVAQMPAHMRKSLADLGLI